MFLFVLLYLLILHVLSTCTLLFCLLSFKIMWNFVYCHPYQTGIINKEELFLNIYRRRFLFSTILDKFCPLLSFRNDLPSRGTTIIIIFQSQETQHPSFPQGKVHLHQPTIAPLYQESPRRLPRPRPPGKPSPAREHRPEDGRGIPENGGKADIGRGEPVHRPDRREVPARSRQGKLLRDPDNASNFKDFCTIEPLMERQCLDLRQCLASGQCFYWSQTCL